MCGAYTFTLSPQTRQQRQTRLEDRQSVVTSLPLCSVHFPAHHLCMILQKSWQLKIGVCLVFQTYSKCITASKMARVCVVLGSVREGRLGLRVARLLVAKLTSLGATPSLLDPLEVNPPLLQQPLHFMKVVLG